MKPFGFLSKKGSGTREQRIPDNRLARVTQSFQRRLDDDVAAVFNRACISNDIEAATDLLALMENWHERRKTSYGGERRINDDALRHARRALERLVVLHRAPKVGLEAHSASVLQW
jgi:hypothetical protein